MEAAGKGLKSFIAVVLVLGLVLGQQQIQLVEANICCPSMRARDTYNICLHDHHYSEAFCAKISGCKIDDDGKCDYPAYSSDSAGMRMKQAVANEDASDAVNRCDEACYRFCTKHVHTAAAATTVVS